MATATNGVNVTDTISYSGLTVGDVYEITATIYKDGNFTSPYITCNPVPWTVEASAGLHTISLGTLSFQPGTYVVYEKAVCTAKGITIKHENPNDTNQTFIVKDNSTPPPPSLQTTVMVTLTGEAVPRNGNSYEAVKIVDDNELVLIEKLEDVITYENMSTGDVYTVTGRLMDVTNPNNIAQVGEPVVKENCVVDGNPWTIEFTQEHIYALEMNRKYVVYEVAVKQGETTSVTHENPNDNAQTVIVGNPTTPNTDNDDNNNNENPNNTTTVVPTTSVTTLEPSTYTTERHAKSPITGDPNTLMAIIAGLGVSASALSLTLGARKDADKK